MRQTRQQTQDEQAIFIKEHWDEYRIGKSFPCTSDMIQELIMNKPDKRIQKRRQDYPARDMRSPRPGSIYWIEALDAPVWFQHDMQDDQIVMALKADGSGKKRRGRPII